MARLWASCLNWAGGAATATVKVVSSDIMCTASLIKEEPNTVFSVLPAVYWHLYSINTYLELSVELLISLGLG